MKFNSNNCLYLVLTSTYNPEKNPLEIAEEACKGGIDILQIREKDMPKSQLLDYGKKIKGICDDYGVTLIVNDDPLLAAELDADGVHLGQEDLVRHSLTKTRALLGNDKIIGISTHSPEQFALANECDFDYVAYGPIFKTQTKDYHIGTSGIPEVLKKAKKPAVFIGGIKESNIKELTNLGCKHIAVITEIMRAENIQEKTRKLKQIINN